jgi:hypothetical protein
MHKHLGTLNVVCESRFTICDRASETLQGLQVRQSHTSWQLCVFCTGFCRIWLHFFMIRKIANGVTSNPFQTSLTDKQKVIGSSLPNKYHLGKNTCLYNRF